MEELTKKLINENFEVFYKNDSLTSSNLISENNFIPSIFNFMQNPLIEENKNTLPSETTSQQQNCIFSEEDIHAPLTIKDKIMLAETFKNLNPEIICTAVNLINQINPIAIEDKDDEKLYIRVDLLNRVVFEKLLK